MNFNSVLIGSENPQPLAEYYTKLFGEPTWNDGGYVGWMIGSGAVTIGPHDQVKGKNAEPGRVIWNIETADVKSEFDRFVEAGATVPVALSRGKRWTGSLHFSDPDRNYSSS